MAEPGEKPSEKLKVFVSYSRADLAFADELASGLDVMGFQALIDRHAIREGEDWKGRLGTLIAEAGTVVFVLSPDSARSSVCAWEVEEAARLSKRIMPVLWRPVEGLPAPARLAALHYTRFDPGEDGKPRSFMEGLKALAKALATDLDWLNEHTRLLTRALEWDRGARAANRLLSGKDITDAKAWAARRPRNAPELTALHLDYIRASEEEEAARHDAARRQLAERERLAREREEAARHADEAAKAAEAAQKDRIAALAQAEVAAKETARSQRRVGRLLWAVGALVLAMLAGTVWASRETEQREILVMLSKAADATAERRYDRAMRYALRGLPAKGAIPYLSPWNSALSTPSRMPRVGHRRGWAGSAVATATSAWSCSSNSTTPDQTMRPPS